MRSLQRRFPVLRKNREDLVTLRGEGETGWEMGWDNVFGELRDRDGFQDADSDDVFI